MRGADAPLDHAPFAIDEFELGETQKEADMIKTFARCLSGDFFIFAQEGRQLELTQMMREQNLRRRRTGGRSRQPCRMVRGQFRRLRGRQKAASRNRQRHAAPAKIQAVFTVRECPAGRRNSRVGSIGPRCAKSGLWTLFDSSGHSRR
jgi:hypothetical protein